MNAGEMVQRTLDEYDTDKDGSLSADEIKAMPERNQSRMASADDDGDGAISKSELTKSTDALIKRIQQGGGGGGGR